MSRDSQRQNTDLSVGKDPEQSASASAIGSSASLSFSGLEDTEDAHVGEAATERYKRTTY